MPRPRPTRPTASTRGPASRPAARTRPPGRRGRRGQPECLRPRLSGQLGLERPLRRDARRRGWRWAGASPASRRARTTSLCVCDDGSLWAWGKVQDHQLGTRVDGVMKPAPARVRLEGDLRARQVAAGAAHSLAVDADGGLWSWGRNAHGQLGRGTRAAVARAAARAAPARAARAVQAAAGLAARWPCCARARSTPSASAPTAGSASATSSTRQLPEMVPLHQFVRQAAAGAQRTARAATRPAACTRRGDGAKGALGHLEPRPRKNKNDTGLASMPSWSRPTLRRGLQLRRAPRRGRADAAARRGAAPRARRPGPVQRARDRRPRRRRRRLRRRPGAGAGGERVASYQKTPETSPLAGASAARGRPPSAAARPAAASSSRSRAAVARRFLAPVLSEVASSAARPSCARPRTRTCAGGGGDGGAGLGVGDATGACGPVA